MVYRYAWALLQRPPWSVLWGEGPIPRRRVHSKVNGFILYIIMVNKKCQPLDAALYTRYTCIHTIYTPSTPLTTPYTPYIRPIYALYTPCIRPNYTTAYDTPFIRRSNASRSFGASWTNAVFFIGTSVIGCFRGVNRLFVFRCELD